MGDFKLPVKSWGDTLDIHSGLDLNSNLLETPLDQHVHKPTRENNVLDLVLTTTESLVSHLSVDTDFSGGGHRIVSFKTGIKEDVKTSEERILHYRRADFDKLRNLLVNADRRETCGASDVNQAWTHSQKL